VVKVMGGAGLGGRLGTERGDPGNEKTGNGDEDCQSNGLSDEPSLTQLPHDTMAWGRRLVFRQPARCASSR